MSPQNLESLLATFTTKSVSELLTSFTQTRTSPRGEPFTLLTNMTVNSQLLVRVADLYAYDLTTPVSRASAGLIETGISTRLQEMSAAGKYSLFF